MSLICGSRATSEGVGRGLPSGVSGSRDRSTFTVANRMARFVRPSIMRFASRIVSLVMGTGYILCLGLPGLIEQRPDLDRLPAAAALDRREDQRDRLQVGFDVRLHRLAA